MTTAEMVDLILNNPAPLLQTRNALVRLIEREKAQAEGESKRLRRFATEHLHDLCGELYADEGGSKIDAETYTLNDAGVIILSRLIETFVTDWQFMVDGTATKESLLAEAEEALNHE